MVSVKSGKYLKVNKKKIQKFSKKFLTNALRYDKIVSVERAVNKVSKINMKKLQKVLDKCFSI